MIRYAYNKICDKLGDKLTDILIYRYTDLNTVYTSVYYLNYSYVWSLYGCYYY